MFHVFRFGKGADALVFIKNECGQSTVKTVLLVACVSGWTQNWMDYERGNVDTTSLVPGRVDTKLDGL
jgi:hypothetical protein